MSFHNWKPKEVIHFLEAQSFHEVHRKKRGSHRYFCHAQLGAFTQVSMSRSPVPIGTMSAIIKQSKIDKSVWKEFCK